MLRKQRSRRCQWVDGHVQMFIEYNLYSDCVADCYGPTENKSPLYKLNPLVL